MDKASVAFILNEAVEKQNLHAIRKSKRSLCQTQDCDNLSVGQGHCIRHGVRNKK
jgi:hypothetical protein